MALSLLASVYAVSRLSTPDGLRYAVPGLTAEPDFGDYVYILIRNGLVLALHALACVAGFMAGSSLPLAAWTIASRNGSWHELLAATFVTTAIAVPVLLVCGLIELYVSPELTRALIR